MHETPTCLFSEKVGVAAVMAHVAVEHVVGHEGKTGPVVKEKRGAHGHQAYCLGEHGELCCAHTQCRWRTCPQ